MGVLSHPALGWSPVSRKGSFYTQVRIQKVGPIPPKDQVIAFEHKAEKFQHNDLKGNAAIKKESNIFIYNPRSGPTQRQYKN